MLSGYVLAWLQKVCRPRSASWSVVRILLPCHINGLHFQIFLLRNKLVSWLHSLVFFSFSSDMLVTVNIFTCSIRFKLLIVLTWRSKRVYPTLGCHYCCVTQWGGRRWGDLEMDARWGILYQKCLARSVCWKIFQNQNHTHGRPKLNLSADFLHGLFCTKRFSQQITCSNVDGQMRLIAGYVGTILKHPCTYVKTALSLRKFGKS